MKKLLVLAVVLAIAYVTKPYWTARTIEVYVQDKLIKDGVSMIYTEEEAFRNEDQWAFLKFNSQTVMAKAVEGRRCVAKVSGFRLAIPVFYTFRNIISIDCKKEESS